MFTRFLDFFLSLAIALAYRIFSITWRIEHCNRPKELVSGEPVICAHWHGDELLLIGPFSRKGYAVMSSQSRDGARMSFILRFLGFHVVRGSSSRGGVGGLKGLIDAVREGRTAALAVDGPRGPLYQVKPGALKLSQFTQCPIIPGAAAASCRLEFPKAWNRCYLPLPFSKVVVVYGEPVFIPKEVSDKDLRLLRAKLGQEMFSLKKEAESEFTRRYDPVSSRFLLDNVMHRVGKGDELTQ